MKAPKFAIDPLNPENFNIPLWAIYGVSIYWPNVLCCRINNASGAPSVWGYSVWKRSPGFCTLGRNVAEWSSGHEFCHFFSSHSHALDYLKEITTPKPGV